MDHRATSGTSCAVHPAGTLLLLLLLLLALLPSPASGAYGSGSPTSAGENPHMPGSPTGGHDTEQGTAPMSTYSCTEGAARQPAAQSSPGGIQDESTITGATRATDAA
jgi:hypothetical protein